MKLILVLSLAAVAGCVPLGSPGALQNGAFAYVCGSQTTDQGCTSLLGQSDIPATIAVGAHFDLQFGGESGAVVAGLVPAAPSILASEAALEAGASGFRFLSPGTVAVLAPTTDSGVVDFVHVTAAPFDHVAIADFSGNPVSALTLTGPTSVSAAPLGAAQQQLAGVMTYGWAAADPTVVELGPVTETFGPNPANQATLTPLKAGTTTVTVTVLDKQASVTVTATGGTP